MMKNTLKKIFMAAVVFVLAFSFSGCGDKKTEETSLSVVSQYTGVYTEGEETIAINLKLFTKDKNDDLKCLYEYGKFTTGGTLVTGKHEGTYSINGQSTISLNIAEGEDTILCLGTITESGISVKLPIGSAQNKINFVLIQTYKTV